MSPTRSPPSAADWRWRSLGRSRDVHAARVVLRGLLAVLYDTVRLTHPTGLRTGRDQRAAVLAAVEDGIDRPLAETFSASLLREWPGSDRQGYGNHTSDSPLPSR